MKKKILTQIRLTVRNRAALFCTLFLLFAATAAFAQTSDTYKQIKALEFDGKTAKVNDLVLKRDRVEMRFTGTLHFAKPVNGKVTAAVFAGEGRISAELPPSKFEKDNLKLLTKLEEFDTTFKSDNE